MKSGLNAPAPLAHTSSADIVSARDIQVSTAFNMTSIDLVPLNVRKICAQSVQRTVKETCVGFCDFMCHSRHYTSVLIT